MHKITRKKLWASLLLVSFTLQSCGVPGNRPSPDGGSDGACTRSMGDGCVSLDYNIDSGGDVAIKPGTGDTPSEELPGETTVAPSDNSFPTEQPNDDEADTGDEGGGGPTIPPRPSQGGSSSSGWLDALGSGLADLLGGLSDLFGDTKKKMAKKMHRLMTSIEEAVGIAQQLNAIEKEVRDNYSESTETIRALINSETYDNDQAINDAMSIAAKDHNQQLDGIVGHKPSLNDFNPDGNICRELGHCSYKNPERQKIDKARSYLHGARSVVNTKFSGEEKQQRDQLLDVAEDLLDAAENGYGSGEPEAADEIMELALQIMDLVVSSVPIAGDIADIASAIAGRNLITGQELTEEEGFMQAASAIASLASGGVVGSIKDIAKASSILKQAAKRQAKKEAKKAGRDAFEAEKKAGDRIDGAETEIRTAKEVHSKVSLPAKERIPLDKNAGYNYDDKISAQMKKRGWDEHSLKDVMENPDRTVATRDLRNNQTTGQRNDDPATAYIDKDGHYVIRNDKTGNIVQISGKNSPNWLSNF